jgi:C1A family cysteine protease
MYNMFRKAVDPKTGKIRGTGWLPPLPDLRDYTERHKEVVEMVEMMHIPGTRSLKKNFSDTPVDLRQWCSPIENQGGLGSCTAHAGMGIVEYFQNRAFGEHIDGSRLFLYKTTRNLLGVTGDTGAWLRNVMGALVLCGVPDERYWQYVEADFDQEPPPFVYAVADNYEAVKYFCHDPLGMNLPYQEVLESVKKYLTAGIPSMFGFYGFPSFDQAEATGKIPYPCPGEQAQWGHAIVAVGYDDSLKIKNTACNKETKGALLIRNSWGTGWGDKGYGWMPYEYVLSNLAQDFWSLISMNWVGTGIFDFGNK